MNFWCGTISAEFCTCKIVVCLTVLQVFTPLYRGVKKTLLFARTSKKSRLKLDQITNDLLLDLVIALWRNNFKSIPCIEEYQGSHSCCSCTIADTKHSSGEGGYTIVLLSFSNVLEGYASNDSNTSKLAITLGFYSFCNDRCDNSIWTNFEASSPPPSDDLQNLCWRQLLVNNFWGGCFWWRQLLMIFRASCLQNLFSSDASLQLKLPFCRIHCSHLFFQNLCLN